MRSLLPAAGSGKRMGAGQNKLFLQLAGKPILMHTLQVFEQDKNCTGIWLAVKPEEREFIQKLTCETCHYESKGLTSRWRRTSAFCAFLY